MAKTLDEIRKKIDSLDDQIHDLLMQRADLIVDVSEAKKKSKTPIVQPAREAKMIRRLLERHRGPLPDAAIVRIWRELVAAVSLLQTGLKVSVSTGAEHAFCWDMAREYFGGVLPMVKVSNPLLAISAVREDESNFAVVPWPQDGDASPWWLPLMNREQEMRIVSAMPYGISKDQSTNVYDRAVVISKTDYAPSGDDRTFVAVKVARDVSRAKIIDVFKDLKLNVLGIVTRANTPASDESFHLVEVADYLKEDDERLTKFAEKFEAMNLKYAVIGGYPAPPIYKITAPEEKAEPLKAASTGTE